MIVDFNDFIGQYVIYYDPNSSKDEIFEKLIKKEWDIIAYRSYIITNKYIDFPLLYRDVITNIKSDDALLFYIINGIEYPIRDDSRFITSLTPFNNVCIRMKGYKKNVKITFTLLMISNEIINNLRSKVVRDSNLIYENGSIYVV